MLKDSNPRGISSVGLEPTAIAAMRNMYCNFITRGASQIRTDAGFLLQLCRLLHSTTLVPHHNFTTNKKALDLLTVLFYFFQDNVISTLK